MEITFATGKIEAALATEKARVREYGAEVARRVALRLSQLHAAPDLATMRSLPGRCHELRGDRTGQLAMDVTGNYRLVFRPTDHPPPTKPDGGLDWRLVQAVTILEVEDYHGD